MVKLITVAAAALTIILTGPSAADEGEPITDAMKPIMAATRIFGLMYAPHDDIGVADEDEGHIGERYEVNHAPGEKCTFTVRRRDGPIIESISFNKLSGEYKTHRNDIYMDISLSGVTGARCDINGTSRKCSDHLSMTLMVAGSPSEYELAHRAFSYIFGNVCKPVQLPF